MVTATTAELLERSRAGDRLAFERLFRPLYGDAFRLANAIAAGHDRFAPVETARHLRAANGQRGIRKWTMEMQIGCEQIARICAVVVHDKDQRIRCFVLNDRDEFRRGSPVAPRSARRISIADLPEV